MRGYSTDILLLLLLRVCSTCTVCLVLTQLYHACNQLRALGRPPRAWPRIMATVVSDMLAANPVGGRVLLGAIMLMLQVLVLQLSDVQSEQDRIKQLLTTHDGVQTCSVPP